MATVERIDWETLTLGDPGPVPGMSWAATLRGTAPWEYTRVFVDVEGERNPQPDYYSATLLVEYPDIRLPATQPFEIQVRLDPRPGSKGYVLRGATKELHVELPGLG